MVKVQLPYCVAHTTQLDLDPDEEAFVATGEALDLVPE
jgi:hypothetical protein